MGLNIRIYQICIPKQRVLVKKKEQKELDDSLKAKREEERAEQKTLVKYEGMTGREKRIAMLTAERAALLQTADTLKSGAKAVVNASQQKEKDWAIHGGIANGIAGACCRSSNGT